MSQEHPENERQTIPNLSEILRRQTLDTVAGQVDEVSRHASDADITLHELRRRIEGDGPSSVTGELRDQLSIEQLGLERGARDINDVLDQAQAALMEMDLAPEIEGTEDVRQESGDINAYFAELRGGRLGGFTGDTAAAAQAIQEIITSLSHPSLNASAAAVLAQIETALAALETENIKAASTLAAGLRSEATAIE